MDADGASTSEKSEQVGVIEEADDNPCDYPDSSIRKRKVLDAYLLDSGSTYHMC